MWLVLSKGGTLCGVSHIVGWHPRWDAASCYWSVDVSLEKFSGRLNHWLFSSTSRMVWLVLSKGGTLCGVLHIVVWHPRWDVAY